MIYPDPLWFVLIWSKELDVAGQQSNLGLFPRVTLLLHIHTKSAVTQSLALPLVWTQLVHSWNSWISWPGGQESHISVLWANATFSPIYYFWHCFPIPQSLTYQENKQNQHNKFFVFLMLLFEFTLIYSFFFTTNLCSLSPSAANSLKPDSAFPLLFLCGHISTWVTVLIYSVKQLPYIQILFGKSYIFLLREILLSFPLSSLPNPLSPPTLVPGPLSLKHYKVTFHTSIYSSPYPLFKAQTFKSWSHTLPQILLRLSLMIPVPLPFFEGKTLNSLKQTPFFINF